MKNFHLTTLLLSTFLTISCTHSAEHNIPSHSVPQEDCLRECNIIYHPDDTEASSSSCGNITFDITNEYYTICLESKFQILEFIGWSIVGEDDYYYDFWSLDVRDNCVFFQPHDDLSDEIIERGFRLDLIICDFVNDYIITSS